MNCTLYAIAVFCLALGTHIANIGEPRNMEFAAPLYIVAISLIVFILARNRPKGL